MWRWYVYAGALRLICVQGGLSEASVVLLCLPCPLCCLCPVPHVQATLGNRLWGVLLDTVNLVQVEPRRIVTAMKIVEREEM